MCSGCGVLCEAFPITDLTSLQLYAVKKCTIVVGDLYIIALPITITKRALFNNLQTIQYIRGSLYMKDMLYITAMTFFSNLVGISGGAHYSNDPILTDGRMPSLLQLGGPVTAEGCDRMCPARYTAVGVNLDDTGCANPVVNIFLHIDGAASTIADAVVLCGVAGRLVTNSTGGQVC